MTAVHQLTPSFAPRDAIGNHILHAQALLREMGLRSEIFVGDAWREVAHLTTPFRELTVQAGEPTWLLYHASTGSPIADFLLERPEPKLLDYHNITPASLFGPWEPHVGVELQAARRQLAELAPHTALALADSSYNEAELLALHYAPTAVVPILFDQSSFAEAVDVRTLDRLRHPAGAVWLFVSRIAPNKAHHDLIKAFAVYRRVYDQHAILRIVGGSASHAYLTALEHLRSALQLDDAIVFTGSVSDQEKAAHFEAADVYVSTSDHEGFGVTLLEAMHHDLPVVAYGSSAVPETMGDGGVCLASKEPTTVAAAVHRVLTDAPLREALAAAGRRRLAAFDLSLTRERLREVIASVVS